MINMEEKNKRRVELNIAGITMSLVTDEPDTFVENVAHRLDESMTELLSHSMKRSQLEAAMLCALDFCGDKLNSEKRVRNLEAQISLYDVNLKRLRDEIADLKRRLAETGVEDGASSGAGETEQHTTGEQIKIDGTAEDPEVARNEKLRLIESLLKKEK